MELRPADLGGEIALEIIRARVAAANTERRRGGLLREALANRPPSKKSRLGALDNPVLRGSGISGGAQKEAVALSQTHTALVASVTVLGMLPAILMLASQGNLFKAGILGAVGLGMSAVATTSTVMKGRRYLSAFVTDDEMAALTGAGHGNALRRDFLQLVRDVSKMEKIAPEAEAGLRDALRSLGDALGQLPFPQASTASSAQLRQNAATVRTQADAEHDGVTQASLLRQADALDRSAQAAERSALLWKRTAALHAELAAQIESLRFGLTAFYTGDADVSGLAALSENVRTVAAEAVSVASARAELDAAPVYAATTAPAQTLTVGR